MRITRRQSKKRFENFKEWLIKNARCYQHAREAKVLDGLAHRNACVHVIWQLRLEVDHRIKTLLGALPTTLGRNKMINLKGKGLACPLFSLYQKVDSGSGNYKAYKIV